MLANASGNILDDEDLINSLDASKVTSDTIQERMIEAKQQKKFLKLVKAIVLLQLGHPFYTLSLQHWQILIRCTNIHYNIIKVCIKCVWKRVKNPMI